MSKLQVNVLAIVIFSLLSFFPLAKKVTSADQYVGPWRIEPNLNFTVASHQGFIYNNRIYILGGSGTNDTDHNEVLFSEINPDGSLNNWSLTTPLPQKIMRHNLEIDGNKVYVLGGSIRPGGGALISTDKVYTNTINSDGTLNQWVESEPLPLALDLGGTLKFNNKIYYIGGVNRFSGGSSRQSKIYAANINPFTGLLENWGEITPPLPEVRAAFSIFQSGNRTIVAGGAINSNFDSNNVITTTINPDGSINSWVQLTSLPEMYHRPGSTTSQGYYLLLGNGSGFNDRIYYSAIDNNLPTGWNLSPISLPKPNCCFPALVNNNYLYVIGGHGGTSTTYYSDAYSIPLSQLTVSESTSTPMPEPTVTPTPVPTPTQTPTSTPTPAPTPFNLNVPLIKQSVLPWRDDIYDHASSWSTTPTIERYGCALTSAAMTLQYYNHSTNPDTLNNWLLSQSDGYLGNGLVNWLAISRYSRLHEDPDSPALEYRRLPASNETLKNELLAGRPGILKLPGHFVVGKGIDQDDILINDPGRNKTKLSEYGGSYLALNQFIPSHTDLSYILFTIDPQYNLKLTNNLGFKVGETFVDEPIDDDVTETASNGESLRTLLLPVPWDGQYNLEVTGPGGEYNLESYLYDTNGNVTQQTLNGLLTDGQKDNITVSYNEETPDTSQKLNVQAIFDDWNAAWSLKKIYDRNFYRSIKTLLSISKRYERKGLKSLEKETLQTALTQIETFPVFIDQHTSEMIQTEIRNLLLTL